MTGIDLSRLPPPEAVESLDPESLIEAHAAQFAALYPQYSAWVESDPAQKLIELGAWREYLLRTRINEAVKGTMLAFAEGADLEHIGALVNLEKEDGETDARFRARIQAAPETVAAAGPAGAYRAIAINADAAVADAAVQTPTPGDVLVTVLGGPNPDGTPPESLLNTVREALDDDDVRPVTDVLTVSSARILPYEIDATLTIRAGVDSATVLAAARQAVTAYALAAHRLGGVTVARSLITAALAVEGVDNVALAEPSADVRCLPNCAPWPTAGTSDSYSSPTTHPLDGIAVAAA